MPMQKSAEAIVGASLGRRAEHERTRVGGGISMTLLKTEACRTGGAPVEDSGRNSEGATARVEADSANHLRTKAEWERESGLMETVCERGNLMRAYERVIWFQAGEERPSGGQGGAEVCCRRPSSGGGHGSGEVL